jgi:hypothetical protein
MPDPRRELESANAAITTAAMLLSAERDLFERFLKEARDMENFGHIVNPTLYRDPERRAMSALLAPLYKAALDFLAVHDRQIAEAKAALEKVNG